MQYIARSVPPPMILNGSAAQMYREGVVHFMRQSREQLSQHALMRSSLHLAHDSMLKALDLLFDGRCAFCEAEGPTQPYRLRPIADAQPYQASDLAHLYYVWMDAAWQNFYAICSSCLPNNAEYFPVVGDRAPLPSLRQFEQYAKEGTGLWPEYPLDEKPVLLDPCLDDDLHKHIGPQGDGRLVGISQRGLVTIEHFSLNADVRVRQREEAYDYYFNDLLNWVCYPELDILPPFPGRPDMSFAGSWYLLLRRLATLVAAKIKVRPLLSRSRIQQVFESLRKSSSANELLRGCWQIVVGEKVQKFSGVRTHRPRADDATPVRICIENFKALESLEITLPPRSLASTDGTRVRTPALLILGENAAGKSSILEAIALGLSSHSAIDTLGLQVENLVLDPRLLGAKAPRNKLAARIRIEFSDQSTRTLKIGPKKVHTPTPNDQPSIPVFAYGAFRQYQRRGANTAQTFVHNLFDGGVLANPEEWLRSLRSDYFAMVIRALGPILSIDESVKVVRWDKDRRQYFVVTATDERNRVLAESSLNAASSGFRSVLAMVCDIMRGLMDRTLNPRFESLLTTPGVVLIDEVEAHLHPRWKMQIMRGLREALPNVTFIVTTHDPLCLRGMDDGETRVLRRVRAGSPASAAGLPLRTEMLEDLPPVSELRVEQLLTSDLFQLHSTDDPEMERQFAEVADLLALEKLDDHQKDIVDRFRKDVVSALPIGTSEAHRLVQEAVADYLKERQRAPEARRREIREAVKQRIIEGLRSVL